MKKFLYRFICFVGLLLLIIALGLFLPATPKESKSLLFSKIAKDSLLKNIPSPRIILIGGSNLSFGINSQIIKDSLGLFPINTGIQASLGIIYMMDDVLQYVREGDVVVLIPEYANYYGKFAYGSEELLRTVLDIYPVQSISLRKEQWLNIAKFIPKYGFSKYNPMEYFKVKENVLYGIQSFNKYGDVDAHWSLKQEKFEPITNIKGELNEIVFKEINIFNKVLQRKKVKFYVSYPSFQKTSFEYCKSQIKEIGKGLAEYNINRLGTAERYCFEDSLMFNKPYHLTKNGLDIRTQLLIEDLKDTMK